MADDEGEELRCDVKKIKKPNKTVGNWTNLLNMSLALSKYKTFQEINYFYIMSNVRLLFQFSTKNIGCNNLSGFFTAYNVHDTTIILVCLYFYQRALPRSQVPNYCRLNIVCGGF